MNIMLLSNHIAILSANRAKSLVLECTRLHLPPYLTPFPFHKTPLPGACFLKSQAHLLLCCSGYGCLYNDLTTP